MHHIFKKLCFLLVVYCTFSEFCYAQTEHSSLALAPFHQINILADSHVVLSEGRQADVWLEGPKEEVKLAEVGVHKDTLTVNVPKGVLVHITTPSIKKMMLGGHANLTGKAMKDMDPMKLAVYGQAQVSLEGPLHLKQILATESANVQILWIHSDHLQVFASGKSHVHLAGDIDVLETKLFDQATLESQYLRADRAFVRTNDKALAKVLAIKQLTAFASNESLIQVYKKPKVLSRFSSTLGNVIMMASWE